MDSPSPYEVVSSGSKFARRVLDWVLQVFSLHRGTKLTALVVSFMIFVVTRDDVSRSFAVPLEIKADSGRVLLTKLPSTLTVEVRGPWSRLSQLTAEDFHPPVLDLEHATEGPLALGEGAIIMPDGVVLGTLRYDRVDLRFDDIVERSVPIVARVLGDVHADYELVSTVLEPSLWAIRGGERQMDEVHELGTTSININGAKASGHSVVTLTRPPDGLQLVGVDEGMPTSVNVEWTVRPRQGERSVTVDLAAVWVTEAESTAGPRSSALSSDATRPSSFAVTLRGPLPSLSSIADGRSPVTAEWISSQASGDGVDVRIRFSLDPRLQGAGEALIAVEPAIETIHVIEGPRGGLSPEKSP